MSKKTKDFDHLFDESEQVPREDFGSLLSRMEKVASALTVGQVLDVEIIGQGAEEYFCSTGTPQDGVIPKKDLGSQTLKIGDPCRVRVLRIRDDGILLRPLSATSAAEVESLEDALDMELPVEGQVVEVVKGGYRVKVAGVVGFCPFSQMDLRPVADPNTMVGQRLEFQVTQWVPPRQLVLSRRNLLQLSRAEQEGRFLQERSIGDFVDGRVTRMESFGAFVEVAPGVEGLVPMSELSWERVRSALDAVKPGDMVNVKILKTEEVEGRLRISLSIKQGRGQLDPWSLVSTEFPVGRVVQGHIEKKEHFGFFVKLKPGITGLLPKSHFRDGQENIESKKPGDALVVQVVQVNPTERKLTLGLPSLEGAESVDWDSVPKEKGLGTFADLFPTRPR